MSAPAVEVPPVTGELPGCGGTLKASPEDFEVEELPAYMPSGEGEHLFLWVEKVGRNTRDLAREIARALGIDERDVGIAGLKDKRARTRQFLSVPRARAAQAERLTGEGWKVLSATPHTNKLKTGHLRGNRFRIRIRETGPDALARAQAVARALEQRGLPNAFGAQRFGREGANAAHGRDLVLRAKTRETDRVRRDRFLRRLYVSAYQALLFNRVLSDRIRDGLFCRAIDGDLMKKTETGGLFHSQEPETDGPRVERFEISPTGPIFGHRMMQAEGEALKREQRVLEAEGLDLESFAWLKGDAEGSRRAMRLPISLEVTEIAGGLELSFALPKGSFATTVLREVMKAEASVPRELDEG
ncbi:MAG: tRNA pseudouridine(13) synthase TruD [Myxococcales bacterium]|jgi:tRNA pseudouridine13 synthase